jgi:hypothetical protein
VDGAEPLERPHPHRPITAAGDKGAATHLQLPYKRCMPLENGLALAEKKNQLVRPEEACSDPE